MGRLWNTNEPSWTNQGSIGSNVTWGMKIHATAGTGIARIGYYRKDSSQVAQKVALYNVTDNLLVWADTSPENSGTNVWCYTECDSGINLVTGKDYMAAVYMLSASGICTGNAGAPVGSAPIAWTSGAPYYFKLSDGLPDQAGTSPVYVGIDIVSGTPVNPDSADPPTSEPNPGTPDPGGTDAWWHSKSTTNVDSATKATYDIVEARFGTTGDLRAVLGTLASALGAANIWGKVQQIASVAADISTAAGEIRNWLGGNGEAPSNYDYYGATEDIRQKVYNLETQVGALPSYPPVDLAAFPSAPWTKTDETTFDTALAWAEPAHLYVVHFDDLGSNHVNAIAAGVDVSYRLAWWTHLNGAFAGQRRFIDTPDYHAWLNGARMPGLLLRSGAGGTGTVEAWTFG